MQKTALLPEENPPKYNCFLLCFPQTHLWVRLVNLIPSRRHVSPQDYIEYLRGEYNKGNAFVNINSRMQKKKVYTSNFTQLYNNTGEVAKEQPANFIAGNQEDLEYYQSQNFLCGITALPQPSW